MTLPPPAHRTPRVSAIVPAYNAERTIAKALESAFAQTWRDFEVIVVDDGSTDATCAALEPWRDAITYVRQPNGGPGRARNRGIARARGDLVAFLDADDAWLPHKLERQIEYFDAFPGTGLLHTAVFLGDPDDRALEGSRRLVAPSPPRQLFCEIFETEIEVHTLSVMAPRAVLVELGGFDERREIHVEDWDLWLRIAARHPVGYIASPLAVHHEGGVMSDALDRTFEGQMRVIERALATYRRLCVATGRGAARREAKPRHRAAWEIGYAHLARNETTPARRAFREALRHDPTHLPTHAYHLGAHLPPRLVARLRSLKRRAGAGTRSFRVAPGAPRLGLARARPSRLVQDTVYRRARRDTIERLRALDDALDGLRGRPRRVLFEAASPLSYVIFKSLHRRLSADPRIEFYCTSTSGNWPADTIFRSVGIADRVIPASRAAWMKVDACINTDFFEMTCPHRCRVRLHMFHGVAGKYGIDSPVHVAPDIATFDALLFPNLDRLERYVEAGLIDERAALLVGFPKVDCLVDGSLDRTAITRALDLPKDRPTILYAPTWSPDSSLVLMGEALVRRLAGAHFNVMVKLHDRSYDLTCRASGGIDWIARLSAYADDAHVRIIRDPDATRYLMAADALVTDHSSIGFEYALLDRPIVVIDTPNLVKRARINPQKVEMLRSAAALVDAPDRVVAAVESELADPSRRSEQRRHLAATLFYRPGTATDRAASVVYDALELDPIAGVAATPDVESAARRAS
jgi:GT2 family glycosyltransferase